MPEAKKTAKEARNEMLIDIFDRLKKIKDCMDKESNIDNPNWGDVGSLAFARVRLEEVMEHYNIK